MLPEHSEKNRGKIHCRRFMLMHSLIQEAGNALVPTFNLASCYCTADATSASSCQGGADLSHMRSEYTEIWNVAGEEILGQNKVVDLPFKRISARAIIIRRSDGSIVGTLHRRGGKYALPGGAPEDGESILEAVVRELEEENI